jgi:hypothetical protein
MNTLTYTFTYSIVSEEEIIVFENEIQKEIPFSFRSFILQKNGGSTKEVIFRESNGNEHYISHFLPLLEGNNGSIKNDIALVNDEKPEINWLPFGFDPGGWTYCISLKKESYGQVFLFRMDKIHEEAFDFIAPSFEEFINNLKPESE